MTRSPKGGRRTFADAAWPRVRRADGEEGMALMLVIGTMLVLTIFASATLAYAVGSLPLSRHDQDHNAALGAAQAGVDDYIRHLNQNDSYWLSPDCTNVALNGPKGTGCNYSATAGWLHVNASDPNGPRFHYDVDSSTLTTTLAVTLRSTGEVNGVSRTLEASIGRGGSTDFVYYTNYETADPDNQVVYNAANYPSGAPAGCSQYWWQGRSTYNPPGNNCIEITFITGDKINGPAHTNDTPLMSGSPEFVGIPKFKYSLETADPACQTATAANHDWYGCWRDTNSQTPLFDKPPGYADILQLPTISALNTDPGCHFVGQTRIRFTGDGNMLVWSPETNSSNSDSTATCGGNAPIGVSVPVPNLQVIYASDDPAVANHQCAANEIGDGLPLAGDITMQTADQFCGQGNIYIEGTLQGRTTVGADNSIVVTGDLLLKNGAGGADILGLVAGNSVQVFHPWIATTHDTATCATLSWTETAGQYVSTTPGAHGGSSLGWQEGYFSGSGVNAVWNPGKWVTSGTSSRYYKGPTSKPTSYPAPSFISAATPPSGTQVWQSGTWVVNSDGTTSWTVGSWQTPPVGKYWQGESWSSTCQAYVQSSPVYSESSTWPHERDLGGVNQIEMYASIQTLQHSFLVQNYDQGTKQGLLTVFGSIAQNYRGIVGQGGGSGTGYLKNYNYDARLVTQAPPYFPQWANAKWATARFGEVPPAYH
jgi:Tfp pilus assembly protein PilX